MSARRRSTPNLVQIRLRGASGAVNKTRNVSRGEKDPLLLYNPDVVNDYFAKVASKDAYSSTELNRFNCGVNNVAEFMYKFSTGKLPQLFMTISQITL